MSKKVEKAGIEDFEDIYPLIIKHFADMPKERFKNLFTHSWHSKENYYGYKLLDGNKVVGFMGYIFSEKIIDKKVEKFCNIALWAVEKEYRNESSFLLFPVFKLLEQGYTITDYTVASAVWPLMTKLNFKLLEKSNVVIPVLPNVFNSFRKRKRVKVLLDDPNIINHLNHEHSKIYKDHEKYKCHHILIKSRLGEMYAVFVIRKKSGIIPVASFHYVSDSEIFLKNVDAIKLKLFCTCKAAFIKVGSRLLSNKKLPLLSFKSEMRKWVFLSKTLGADKIDSLYSELILFDQ